jgi:competence protein ComEC
MARSLALLCALLLLGRPAIAKEEQLRINFISVGQGDATLVRSPTGKRILVDGGPSEGTDALLASVTRRGTEPLDLVLLTHRHADHLGGLVRLLSEVGARTFLDAPFPHPSPLYERLLRVLEARHIPVRDAIRGRKVDLGGGAILELLGPPEQPLSRTRSDVNANSVVSRIDYRRASILMAADAEAPTERWLLKSGARLDARVLKVAHHGSRYSSTPAFLRAVKPEIAVISAGRGNDYGHPAPETIQHLERLGSRVYRTDEEGSITLESDGEQLQVEVAQPKMARP